MEQSKISTTQNALHNLTVVYNKWNSFNFTCSTDTVHVYSELFIHYIKVVKKISLIAHDVSSDYAVVWHSLANTKTGCTVSAHFYFQYVKEVGLIRQKPKLTSLCRLEYLFIMRAWRWWWFNE